MALLARGLLAQEAAPSAPTCESAGEGAVYAEAAAAGELLAEHMWRFEYRAQCDQFDSFLEQLLLLPTGNWPCFEAGFLSGIEGVFAQAQQTCSEACFDSDAAFGRRLGAAFCDGEPPPEPSERQCPPSNISACQVALWAEVGEHCPAASPTVELEDSLDALALRCAAE